MIFPLCKCYSDINWHIFEKRWADVFQIYPNAIYLNPLQICPSMPLLGLPVFCLSSSMVLNRYFHILVNSMTMWSVLKLPKIAWPSPFNKTDLMMAPAKRICILMAKVKMFFPLFPCFYRVSKNTCESLGELEKLWKHSPAAVPTAFLILPNYHLCFYNSIETRYMLSIKNVKNVDETSL